MEKNCLGKLFIRQFLCFVVLDERRMANTTLEDIKTRACLKNRKHRLFVQNVRFLCWKSSTGDSLSCGFRLETTPFCLKNSALSLFSNKP